MAWSRTFRQRSMRARDVGGELSAASTHKLEMLIAWSLEILVEPVAYGPLIILRWILVGIESFVSVRCPIRLSFPIRNCILGFGPLSLDIRYFIYSYITFISGSFNSRLLPPHHHHTTAARHGQNQWPPHRRLKPSSRHHHKGLKWRISLQDVLWRTCVRPLGLQEISELYMDRLARLLHPSQRSTPRR